MERRIAAVGDALIASEKRFAQTDSKGTTSCAGRFDVELDPEFAMPRYSKSASKDVKGAMHKKKQGTLKTGSGKKVKSRKQAIAIGLSEARRKGKMVPSKKKT
jgi:hypothetical protein